MTEGMKSGGNLGNIFINYHFAQDKNTLNITHSTIYLSTIYNDFASMIFRSLARVANIMDKIAKTTDTKKKKKQKQKKKQEQVSQCGVS